MASTSIADSTDVSTFPGSLLFAGLTLGLCGDLLVGSANAAGPGIAIWMGLFGLAACRLAYDNKSMQFHAIAGWSVVSFLAALMLIFRTHPVIILAMLATMLTAATMVIMELNGTRLKVSLLSDQIAAGIRVPLQAVSGAIPVLGTVDIRTKTSKHNKMALLRGLLIAIPLILVFGSLFIEADQKFEALATNVLSIFSPELPQHIFRAFVFFWLATGLLAVIYKEPQPLKFALSSRFSLGKEETLIIMGSLTALFITFVLLQLPYLFGGRETIASTEGLTLANYARRGFFELVAVSGLTLGILLVMAKASQVPKLFRPLAGVLLACLLLILLSALQRLLLYTQSFGLTVDRITALTFLLWIAVCLALYGMIILRGQSEKFAMGMTCSAVVIAFGFALISPARFVISVNTEKVGDPGYQLDLLYFKNLGSPGIPVLLDNLELLPDVEQCFLSENWLQALKDEGPLRYQVAGTDDWRSWNLEKSRAKAALEAARDRLPEIRNQTCPQNRGH